MRRQHKTVDLTRTKRGAERGNASDLHQRRIALRIETGF
jgi:hypothetical protein